MIRFPKVLSVLLLLVALPAARAEDAPADPWYQVEVIVFEHAGASGDAAGDWQADGALPALDRALELVPAADPLTDPAPEGEVDTLPSGLPVHPSGAPAFQLLGDDELRMAAVMNRLMVSSAYAPLVHLAWRQPATTEADFGGVRVHSGIGVTAGAGDGDGDRAPDEAPAVTADDAETADAPDASVAGTEDKAPGAEPAEGVDGIVRLSRGRFLHLNLDLVYRRPGVAPTTTGGLFGFLAPPRPHTEVLRLTNARRVRADELQYFDHPRFGAIVLVTPFAPLPEADEGT